VARSKKAKKKRTEEQIERDHFVEDLLIKHSNVMHVDTEEYMKAKGYHKAPSLSTNPKVKAKKKEKKES